jgi:methylation protein EvaC
MSTCRICATPVEAFIDFGQMPISNGFLSPDRFADEYFYNMRAAVCPTCATLQVIDVPDASQMYHKDYAYYASTSAFMTAHFKAMAEDLMARFVSNENPFVVEIGCNDGITLQNFASAGIPHLGVEPSGNVAEVARSKGVSVLNDFFSDRTAAGIVAEHGQADLFIATNTMHNIEDINAVGRGVQALLKPGGVMVQEDPYLGDMIEHTTYDLIYAEHMYIWSVTSLNNAFGRHGLEVFDAEHNDVHGGCMRYFLCHRGAHAPTERLKKQLAREEELGLADPATYEAFATRCLQSRDKLSQLLADLKAQGKEVAAYGATAKSTTILNYCGLGPDDISFISDSTPAKQGKYSPGRHILIAPPEHFAANLPDYAVLFAWNHFEEINAKEQAFRDQGGQWIIPVRMVEVI